MTSMGEVPEVSDLDRPECRLSELRLNINCGRKRGRAMQTIVVLHGPSTLPAAVDVESKFTEAALGSVQVADFRHFAHGRHHWIAKRGRESAVLAITSND